MERGKWGGGALRETTQGEFCPLSRGQATAAVPGGHIRVTNSRCHSLSTVMTAGVTEGSGEGQP